jgi:pimeloyl-ACP methyl ester carboxylesterase
VARVDILGFSMGGLVALHAVKFLAADQYVRRVVTLGTPFAGTWVGLAGVATVGGICPSVWQVLPSSKFLLELSSAPLPPGVEVRQIHATNDAFCPAPGPIEGVRARDYFLLPGGHSSLVVADNFYQAAREFLDESEPDPTHDAMHAAE